MLSPLSQIGGKEPLWQGNCSDMVLTESPDLTYGLPIAMSKVLVPELCLRTESVDVGTSKPTGQSVIKSVS